MELTFFSLWLCTLSSLQHLYNITAGKFKGKANDFDLSLDDLVDLLNSVDHHKVVDSRDAVITDEQLEALLDRTLTSTEKDRKKKIFSALSGHPKGDQHLFRVIEERDTKGNVTRESDDSAPTTDTWHIVTETEGASAIVTKADSSGANNDVPPCCGDSSGAKITPAAIDSTAGDDHNQTEARTTTDTCNSQSNSPVSATSGAEQANTVSVDCSDSGASTNSTGKAQRIVASNAGNVEPVSNPAETNLQLCESDNVLHGGIAVSETRGLETNSNTMYSALMNHAVPSIGEERLRHAETIKGMDSDDSAVTLENSSWKLSKGAPESTITHITMNEA